MADKNVNEKQKEKVIDGQTLDIIDSRFRSIHGAALALKEILNFINIQDKVVEAQLNQILHDSNQEIWDEPV